MIKISFRIRFRFVDGNGVIVIALAIVMSKCSILLCLSTEQEHGILGHMLQRTSFINKAKYNSEPETMRQKEMKMVQLFSLTCLTRGRLGVSETNNEFK